MTEAGSSEFIIRERQTLESWKGQNKIWETCSFGELLVINQQAAAARFRGFSHLIDLCLVCGWPRQIQKTSILSGGAQAAPHLSSAGARRSSSRSREEEEEEEESNALVEDE